MTFSTVTVTRTEQSKPLYMTWSWSQEQDVAKEVDSRQIDKLSQRTISH